jgi:protein-S-isoprenylcysteine O-methyltransferase Ste14
MDPNVHEGPGLRVHPPVIYLAALLIGIGLNHWRPLRVLPGPWGGVVGVALIVAGVAIMPPVLLRFRRADTPFNPHKPASALITDGPYRFSRNPAYVALTLWYLGVGFLLNNGWVLLWAIPVLLAMDRWVVRREEQHLEARFGEQYLRYKSAVRRWL